MHTPPFPHLTPEQRAAIAASDGLPIQVEDPDTHKLYILAEHPQDILLDEVYVHNKLVEGVAAIDAGKRVPWDPERIKQEGRQRLKRRTTPE